MSKTNTSSASDFFSIISHPLKFRLFLWKNLPAAYFSGVRVKSATPEEAIVTVPYKWFTRNPFRSTYFACMSMAAEMSTGVLAMAHLYKSSSRVALLVVAVEGKFYKKATSKTYFRCTEGKLISDTIQRSIDTGEAQSIRVLSSGYNAQNELMAEFWVTWSFKRRV